MVSLTTLLGRPFVKYMLTTLSNTLLFFVGIFFYVFLRATKNNSIFVIFYFLYFNERLINHVANLEHMIIQ